MSHVYEILHYLFARSAASFAADALTRSDTLEMPPAWKHSTIPWFLLGQ